MNANTKFDPHQHVYTMVLKQEWKDGKFARYYDTAHVRIREIVFGKDAMFSTCKYISTAGEEYEESQLYHTVEEAKEEANKMTSALRKAEEIGRLKAEKEEADLFALYDLMNKFRPLLEKCTPAPWNNTDNPLTVMAGDRMVATCGYARSGQEGVQDTNKANAEFIALSREAIPLLIDKIDSICQSQDGGQK